MAKRSMIEREKKRTVLVKSTAPSETRCVQSLLTATLAMKNVGTLS